MSANLDTFTVVKGETLQLNCSADGNPVPSYTWTGPSGDTLSSSSVLTIESVDLEHKGQYICTVESNMKSVQGNFTVDVQGEFT